MYNSLAGRSLILLGKEKDMGKCPYCGKDAGLLRRVHSECQKKHDTAIRSITEAANKVVLSGGELAVVSREVTAVASEGFISTEEMKKSLIQTWTTALDRALDDGVLSQEEENALVQFAKHFDLSITELDANGAYTRAGRAAILRDLIEGKPIRPVAVEGDLPFNLQRSESLVYAFLETKYYAEKVTRRFEGGSHGVSIRVAKGLYYRIGAFKGHPVETSQMVLVDTGFLGVTTKNIYFAGGAKAIRIPYSKVTAFRPYSDGIGLFRDRANAKQEYFITGDGWFTYNLVINLSKSA